MRQWTHLFSTLFRSQLLARSQLILVFGLCAKIPVSLPRVAVAAVAVGVADKMCSGVV